MKRLIPVVPVLLLPSVVLAAPRTFSELVSMAVEVLNSGVMVLVVLAIVVYFLGLSTSILKVSEDEATKRRYFLWGVLVLFVMVSIWGILNLIQNTILGTSLDTGGSGLDGSALCDSFGNCGLE